MTALVKLGLAAGAWLLLRRSSAPSSSQAPGEETPAGEGLGRWTGPGKLTTLVLRPREEGVLTGIRFSGSSGFSLESVDINRVMFVFSGKASASGTVPVTPIRVAYQDSIQVKVRNQAQRAQTPPRTSLVMQGETKTHPAFYRWAARRSQPGV